MRNISATSYQTYLKCPKQWFYNYRLPLLKLPYEAFDLGKTYHKCLERFHSGDSPQAIINDTKKTILDEPTKDAIKRFALVRTMFEKYAEHPVSGKVVDVEKKFDLEMPGISQHLKGFIDRVDTDKGVEYKTSSFDYKPEDFLSKQSLIYAYCLKRETGKDLPIVFSVMNKKKATKKSYIPQTETVVYKEKDFRKLESDLVAHADNLLNNRFEHSPGDHCRWCPFGKNGVAVCKKSR